MTDFERQLAQHIRGLDLHDQPDPAHKARLQEEMKVLWTQIHPPEPSRRDGLHHLWRAIMNSPYTKVAAAAIVLVVVYISMAKLSGPERQKQNPTVNNTARPTETQPDQNKPSVGESSQPVKETLAQAFQNGDVKPLIQALDNDKQDIRVLAAGYLGQLGATEALAPLAKLAAQWQGPGENPYATAIKAIRAANPSQTKTQGQAPKDQPASTPSSMNVAPAQPVKNGLLVTVVAQETGKPLAGLKVKINMPHNKSQAVTDQHGQVQVLFQGEEPPQYLEVTVKAEGRVPTQASYQKSLGQTIPRQLTLSLEQGTSIGGYIRNEQDEPIAQATIHLLVPTGQQTILHPDIHDYTVTTGAHGFWHCDIMPGKLDDVWIRLTHPDYINDNIYGATKQPSMTQLRHKTGVMIMRKGVTVSGWVFDTNSQPIADASVAQGSDRWGRDYPSTHTDANGYFEFANASPHEEMILTVQAKNYAPDLRSIRPRPGMEDVVFSLEPGYTIEGVIVDSNDDPVAGAFIDADTWRGHRSIDWRQNTDAQGRFAWHEAPKDEVLFDMGKQGFMYRCGYVMTARSEAYNIILLPPLKVTGHVVDADTGKPVEQYTITLGFANHSIWDKREATKFTSASYELTISEPRNGGYALRVEADGYEPAISRTILMDENSVSLDFALKPLGSMQRLQGIVCLAHGDPAAKTDVVLVTAGQRVSIQDGHFIQKENLERYTQTQADGQFSFSQPEGDYQIVALHDQGCAMVDANTFSQTETIILEPWARIKGTLLIGSDPGKDRAIVASPISDFPGQQGPRVYWDNHATTDPQGHFEIDRVHPGQVQVAYEIPMSSHMTGFTQSKNIEVQPGQTTNVTLGGMGRPVVGQVMVPPDLKAFGSGFCRAFINTHAVTGSALSMQPSYPEGFGAMSYDQQNQWLMEWVRHRPPQKYSPQDHRSYPVVIQDDGTFRVDDISAGHYVLSVSFMQNNKMSRYSGVGTPLASTKYTFDVPPMETGRSDVPLDLGQIKLKRPTEPLAPGDEAPTFIVKDINDRPFNLSQQQGTYVLLDFWTMLRPETEDNMKRFTELAQEFAGDNRLVIVGIIRNMPTKVVIEFTQSHQIHWRQISLVDPMP